MARILLIDEAARQRIARAIERARLKPVPLAEVNKTPKLDKSVLLLKDRKGALLPRDQEQVYLARGYRLALTFEEQPIGLCLHLSAAVDTPGRVPNIPAMLMICEACGFKKAADGMIDAHMWMEEFEPGHFAINAVGRMDDD